MDFVEGPSLRAWLRQQRPSVAQALQMFAAMVQAVSHAHDHNVVHRDLRPGTVLLAPAGADRFTPRVADWGLAKVRADSVGPLGGLTTVQRGLGTAGYAAPEQVRDASSAGPAADVFSLGCVLYELLTGQPPFHGRSELDAAMAARDEQYTPLDRAAPGLHPALVDFVHLLLAGDPERRPPNARAVWELLMELPPELSVEEAPVAPWRRSALLSAPLLVALGIGALVVALFG
jgi:serine/threonine protein kinase